MTYSAKETSVYGGNPLYLYRFTRGGTQYDYSSLATDRVFTGTPAGTFLGSSIQHGKINVGQIIKKDTIDVVFPLDDEFASLLLKKHTQFLPTTVTIWRGHLDDPAEEFRVIFKGRVRAGKIADRSKIALVCTGLMSLMEAPGLGGYAHRSCRWAVYFGGCQLNKADFEDAGTVSAISGSTCTIVEAAAQANGFYSGGILEFQGFQTLITTHTGNQVSLRSIPDNLIQQLQNGGPAAVTIAPGCDRSITTCKAKFNNVVNFGGFPYFPEKDPWRDGSVV